MRFNPRASIDQSQIETRSGGGGGGGGSMIPLPGGGGRIGLGTVVIIVIFLVVQHFAGGGGGGTTDQQSQDSCRTGADANSSESCAVDLFTNSVQDYWSRAYPQQSGGKAYEPIKTVRFQGSTASACGQASQQMGPFYCPNDRKVYLDTTFFDQMLTGELGAKGGPFAIGYVIAHEYGHHI
jgi:predicted metalloprotease